ncbi:hypothetical protein TNCV_2606921 [Trichonephila clavipes]|uniref:Uncharacterized protein n=1 Tax=Trichonephila clavipes TaxID=2585209 RepID=A0A8X6VCW6_TRICX|nr:hypothetical protein TNCV_2606921 [Trichonephila clavipes]
MSSSHSPVEGLKHGSKSSYERGEVMLAHLLSEAQNRRQKCVALQCDTPVPSVQDLIARISVAAGRMQQSLCSDSHTAPMSGSSDDLGS